MPINVSKEIQENINTLDEKTFCTLKDFQKKTVERVASLYENNQNRVLVADEVGLGKTMIAKCVITKLAKIRINEGDDLFKVVYVCSNQAIAKQNIKTLGIGEIDTSDTRLSMQHLKIARQENNTEIKQKFIQIIPLTPGTSFEMSQGVGSIKERALMYAVLKRANEFENDADSFRRIMVRDATKSGFDWLDYYDNQVSDVWQISNGLYPQNVISALRNETTSFENEEIKILDFARIVLDKRKERNCRSNSHCGSCPNKDLCRKLISDFRIAFAKISTEKLNPDFVIMDEFQRFNSLIDPNNNEDSGIIARTFLKENPEDDSRKTRVLLLSATPYKLYSTLQELDEDSNNPYDEFFKVMDFLFEKNKECFRKAWQEYSELLQSAKNLGFEILKQKKSLAEIEMYKGVCRTERLSVMQDNDFIDDSNKNEHLKITQGDILSFMQMQKIIDDSGANQNVPTDYVKSSPFLMSFMEDYKVKENIKKAFIERNEKEDFSCLDKEFAWLNKESIENYKELPKTNARLELLKEKVFSDNAEKLLWIPPCKPYYALEGAYRGIESFSKTLVFSSWEMVPRMISTLISYEAERRIYGSKFKYSDERKFARRLEFRLKGKEPATLNLFTLIYPSKTLSDFFNPIDCLNRNISLLQIKNEIKAKISAELANLKKYEKTSFLSSRKDSNRWYYLAPILMDGLDFARNWLSEVQIDKAEQKNEKDENRYSDYLTYLRNLLREEIILGKMPEDLEDYLTEAALSSFAVCYYRSCKDYDDEKHSVLKNATDFAKVFIKNFNAPEVIAIVDSLYKDDYLLNVLHYCADGCFQGMLDEYIHLLQRNNGSSFQTDLIKNLDMLQTSHYEIDTVEAFKNDLINAVNEKTVKKNEEISKLEVRKLKINMRSHFAVCFSKSVDKNEGERKENLRNAFNSPLRPFVLASTSIGQEGLDFHNYCRKIMHWNLPSNPIDLEQREGRINRYKCLAIRQNVALLHGNIQFKTNIWNEMFEEAKRIENGGKYSELIPFWVFGKNQKIKIERILPIYPMSSDITRYERLIKILSLYRMTLGQPRQEELLEYVFSNCNDEEIKEMKELFINLSPWGK